MDATPQAVNFLSTCCSHAGAFSGSTDVYRFLADVASEMAGARPSRVFPDRYIEHVAHAVHMVSTNEFLSPPAAIASVYLVTRFEFYFRALSGKLNPDGTWCDQQQQVAALASINDSRLKKSRISSVGLAYRIMKLNQSLEVVKWCTLLDSALYATPTTVVGATEIHDIGGRIEFGRHAVGHGHWGDISSEAVFYGLMTAIVFYNQS